MDIVDVEVVFDDDHVGDDNDSDDDNDNDDDNDENDNNNGDHNDDDDDDDNDNDGDDNDDVLRTIRLVGGNAVFSELSSFLEFRSTFEDFFPVTVKKVFFLPQNNFFATVFLFKFSLHFFN